MGLRLLCGIAGDLDMAREERLAQNEVLFRTVNETIEQKAIEFEFSGIGDYQFICECASTLCFDRVSMTLREYEQVRKQGAWFLVVPGHEYDEIELVVETKPTYLIVAKDGAAGVVAELADPRDGDPDPHVPEPRA